MRNGTNFSALCAFAEEVTTDGLLQTLLVLEAVLGTLATVGNLVVMAAIWRVGVFHANLRCLLLMQSLNLALFSYADAVKSTVTLIYVWTGQACRLVMRTFVCKLVELPITVPLVASVYTLIALCLERLCATVRFRHYERSSGGTPWLALTLVVAVYAGACLNQCLPLGRIPKDAWLPICVSLLSVSLATIRSVVVQNLSVEAVALALAAAVYLTNRRMAVAGHAGHDLTSRFQLSQNLALNRALLPSVLLHVVCVLSRYCFLLSMVGGLLSFSERTRLLLLHLNYVWSLVHAVGHPICLARNPHMLKVCRAMAPGLFAFCRRRARRPKPTATSDGAAAAATPSADGHFEILQRIWQRKPDGGPCRGLCNKN